MPEIAQGTCLFADISGFTPLAESLGESLGARRGAETLAATINQIFERLIFHVHRYGGDVMGFAGDAITCWFPEADSPLLAVLACALKMQAEMTQFVAFSALNGSSHSLSMKIGLAYGPVRRMLVGDPKFGRFDLLAGQTLDRMAGAERHAQKGEIVCAPEVVALIAGQAVWRDERDGFCSLDSLTGLHEEPQLPAPIPDLPLDVLRPFFPKDIFNWLVSAGEQFLAELRPVVSAFVRFTGLDYLDDPQVSDKLDSYLGLVQQIAVQHGGNLVYVDYGDKGSVLHVLFGAPVSHEDDEVRAVGWALELQTAVRNLPFITAQYIGISKGPVYAGPLGASTRRGYTVIGDQVNASSRLMQACQPGQILVSQRVMKAARKRFAFHQFPGFQVKGKSGPIPVAMPMAELPSTQQIIPVGPLIGRHAEMAQLETALEALLIGKGGVVSIEGAEGVGKSRLAAELALRAMQRGARTLVGRAQSVGQNAPYLPWREVFQGLFGLQPAWPVLQQTMQIQSMLGWINPDWLPKVSLLGDLLGFEIADTPETAAYDAQERQSALFNLVGDLLTRMSEQQPLLILLEDCHWADRASAALIEALGVQRLAGSRVLLVLTHWPADELGKALAPTLSELEGVLRLELGELDPEAAHQMLTARLGGEPSPDLLIIIQERAQGNPLFLEELSETIRETNWLQMEAGRWVLVGDERGVLRLPDTIQGVILARLDRLDESSKLTLKVASVVGATFEEFIIKEIHPSSPEQVELIKQLSLLEKRELSRLILPEPHRTYRFWHNVIQEVTYDTLLFSQRRRLHQSVAEWIEAKYRAELTPYYPLLAHHYQQSGIIEKAIEYLLKTGDLARRLYAHQEAIQQYERALELLEKQGEAAYDLRARTLMKLALTCHTAFDYARARQTYEEGFRLWQLAAEAAPRLPRPPAPHALRMDWLYMPVSLDPAYAEDTESYGIVDQLFSGLVDLGPGLEVLPNVAQRWEIQEDGRRYLFHLREDVHWSDGTPLTAQDFEYAWRRVLEPATDSPLARILYDIKGARAHHGGLDSDPGSLGISVLSDYTLAVELESPCSYFLYLMTSHAGFPVPRHAVEALGEGWAEPERLVTNGPFRLDAWEMVDDQNGQLALTRSPSYHGNFGGNLDRVELRIRPDAQARLAAYERDELDTLSFRDLGGERRRVRDRYADEYFSAPLLATVYLGFNTNCPPFDEPCLRQAFIMAVDRERYADVNLQGFVFPGMGGFMPPGMPGHSSDIGLPYDPQGARELLAQSGFPGGQGFPEVEFLAGPDPERQIEYLVSQWRENLGVQVAAYSVDWDTFSQRLEHDLPHIFVEIWVSDYPDPDDFMRASSAIRFLHWEDSEYQNLVEVARSLTDQAGRLKIYRQAEQRLVGAGVLMPFKYLRNHFLIKPWVKNFPTSATEWWYWRDVVIEAHNCYNKEQV